jgi:putative FmdB family regulatory protein
MPIYEYRCDACDNVFEEWRSHADDIMEEPCPRCGKTSHRLISNTSFVLKGGGWYVTEYGGRKAEAAPKPSEAATTEATPAAPKTETAATPPPAAEAPKPAAAAD